MLRWNKSLGSRSQLRLLARANSYGLCELTHFTFFTVPCPAAKLLLCCPHLSERFPRMRAPIGNPWCHDAGGRVMLASAANQLSFAAEKGRAVVPGRVLPGKPGVLQQLHVQRVSHYRGRLLQAFGLFLHSRQGWTLGLSPGLPCKQPLGYVCWCNAGASRSVFFCFLMAFVKLFLR